MIVATAGHIDHGKTSLVKALTGVDTDRLPEEKRRGLSIDIGFSYPSDCQEIGFVDVPGHERFVRNMIAGVAAIDFALLVIAADDGPMPQTVEHVAILELLSVKRGAVALTKIDRIESGRIAEARAEIRALLGATHFSGAPIFPVSCLTGEGVEDLKQWLMCEARKDNARKAGGHFRMSIDRAFNLEGAGLVVTGAVAAGSVRSGDRLVLAPAGVEVRVRSLRAQNRQAQAAQIGDRCALNLTAPRLSLADIHRGHWLLAPPIHAPTTRFDCRMRLLASETRNLRHWSGVHLHVGAACLPARVALLEVGSLAPGKDALAQIVTQAPVSVLFGDHFVLRDPSGRRTIGGGRIIDPFAPARGRARPERRALLNALELDHEAEALRAALPLAPQGFGFGEFICARNLVGESEMVFRNALDGARIVGAGRESRAVTAQQWNVLRAELLRLISVASSGVAADGTTGAMIRRRYQSRTSAPVIDALLEALVAEGEIVHVGGSYFLRGAARRLEPSDAALWSLVEQRMDSLRPPTIAELAVALNLDTRRLDRLLREAARLGVAIQIAPNRYYLPGRLQELARCAALVAQEAQNSLVSVRDFRDKSGVGRNLSVEALEFFDRVGFTARAGEHRRVLKPVDQVRWLRGVRP